MSCFSTRLRIVVLAAAIASTCLPARAEVPPQVEQMRSFVQLMSGYYALMNDIHGIGADPDKTAVLQMTKLKEYLEQSGEADRAEDVLRRIATTSERPAVRNVATSMLAEMLANRGNRREAAAVLERALLGTPAAR